MEFDLEANLERLGFETDWVDAYTIKVTIGTHTHYIRMNSVNDFIAGYLIGLDK